MIALKRKNNRQGDRLIFFSKFLKGSLSPFILPCELLRDHNSEKYETGCKNTPPNLNKIASVLTFFFFNVSVGVIKGKGEHPEENRQGQIMW